MKKFFTLFLLSLLMTVGAYADTFEKVTGNQTDWSGEYLLTTVVGNDVLVWNGLDAGQNCNAVALTDGNIIANNLVTITVEALEEGGYSIKVNGGDNDGKYITSGTSAPSYSNALKFVDKPVCVDIEMVEGVLEMKQVIADKGIVYLLYNTNAGENNERYRFYKDSNKGKYGDPILYKKVSAPAAGWDGTITTSKDYVTLKSWQDLEGLTIKFNGANSVQLAEEDGMEAAYFEICDTWAYGNEVYVMWSPMYGSEYTINGDEITLTGFFDPMSMMAKGIDVKKAIKKAKAAKKAAEGESDYQLNMYGDGFIVDGVLMEDQIDLYFNCESPAVPSEPFMLTAVENNGVAGNLIGAVEASENGVSYQFNVTAADKNLSNGTAIPTLTLMEDASVDFGAASVTAYGSDQAYIRFMSRQEPFFTTSGTYILSIPEGTFVDADGTPNAAVTLKWVIIQKEEAQPFDITAVVNGADTEPGAEVDALNYNFAITAANAITAVHEGNITLTDASGAQVGGNAYVFGYEGEGGATTVYARFSFDSEDHLLHTAGTYTLNIPAGMFKDAEGGLNNEFSATWTVKEQAAKVPFDITSVTMNWMGEAIESGAEVEALSYMYNVTCDKEGLVAGEGHIEFKDAEGNGIGVGSWNGYYLSFMSFGQEGYKTPGTYTLTIPAGALVDAEGNPCNEYTATWTVTGKVLDKSTAEGQITDIQTLLDENKETLGDDYTTFSEELNKISDELAAATTQSEVDEISNKLNTLYGDIQTALNEAAGINFATLATKANGKYVKGGQIVIVKNGKLFNTAGQNIK